MSQDSKIKVFLSVCGEEQLAVREELFAVLRMAGMDVISGEESFKEGTKDTLSGQISSANCSVHILFPQYAPLIESGSDVSLAKYQFYEAKKKLEQDPKFRMFIWLPPVSNTGVESRQMDFINEVRNNVSKNMVFSNSPSAIQLVDDLRSITEVTEAPTFDISATEVFLVSNQLDEMDATEVIDMLSDVVPVENLTIIQDEDIDYSELCKQQIPMSKLAVVYYKHTEDWAIPFTQQVWKKIGGAASHTPILLIGDEDPNGDGGKKFNAPKVISMIVAGELIPLEIKIQYDKVTG